ncbi:Sec1 vATPase [Giardia lamblia P15]|uniref:Sec1 vATPase n=1 Tax=Giardia intestinalis (strain P15) TaxID=658858 RepID=E1EWT7_GIAIA|nr:Sec1 vATPase [Giardia lamblia P15]
MISLSFEERAYDLSDLLALQRESLVMALSNVPEGNRVFLLDEKLRDPLSLIAGDLFKDNEVMFLSTATKPNPKTDINLVVVFDSANVLDAISGAKMFLKARPSIALHFLVTPTCDQYVEQLICDTGLSDQVHTLEAFSYNSVFLDIDVITLNLHYGFNHMLYQKSMTAVQRSAQALLQIANTTGLFRNIYARGPEGVRCLRSFLAELKSKPAQLMESVQSRQQPFEHVFLIDRGIDLLSLTLDPWTYEALLAETFSLHNSALQTDKDSSTTYLNFLDPVYRRLRATHISKIKSKIDKILEELKEVEQEKEQAIAGRDNLSLQQIRLIREKSVIAEKNQKFTEYHVGLANSILKSMSYDLGQAFVLKRDLFREGVLSKRVLDYVLLRIMENAPFVEIIQLYLLILITSQPKPKDLQIIRSNISARYGVSADFLFDTFDRSGLLPALTSKSWFKDLRTAYTLWYDEDEHLERAHGVSVTQYRDISDVFNSRAPLSVRMVERELKAILSSGSGENASKGIARGGSSADSALEIASGSSDSYPYVPTTRIWGIKRPLEAWSGSIGEDVRLHSDLVGGQQSSSVLVVFLGGVTYAELAALSILEEQLVMQYGPSVGILTIGTDVASGREILESLVEKTHRIIDGKK